MLKNTLSQEEKQEAQTKSREIGKICVGFVRPVLEKLDKRLDSRLVQTFLDLVVLIVMHRDRHQGLVLSELGGELLGEKHAPAGAKRISRLLHAPGWQTGQVEAELWRQADEQVEQWNASQEEALVIWDESENEKPESLATEGLCPSRSSKAARLKRIKPGYYNPPGGPPIFVPGFHWLQLVVAGMKGPARLAHLRWWTSRGPRASDKRTQEESVLARVAQTWGRRVVHVFDQGYAGAPWTQRLLDTRLLFVIRWKKHYQLVGPQEQAKKAWELLRGKRSVDHKQIWDARRRCRRTVGIIFLPVHLPGDPRPLWLVASRPGPGHKPWYLLTDIPVLSAQDAWHMIFIYARRWSIEMTFRFQKSELAFESPRLHDWDARFKLLSIAALVHAFLISLLAPCFDPLKLWLLDSWCHRNGKWSRDTPTPLYRLRLALAHLWLAFSPFSPPLLNSG
jgi:hypothetical protein